MEENGALSLQVVTNFLLRQLSAIFGKLGHSCVILGGDAAAASLFSFPSPLLLLSCLALTKDGKEPQLAVQSESQALNSGGHFLSEKIYLLPWVTYSTRGVSLLLGLCS